MNALALLPLLAAPAVAQDYAQSAPPDPAVRVWLDRDGEYDRGDGARVYVRPTYDGYLFVLHADPDGRVRVLFPVDPGGDDFVRGTETVEIRGRGDREAFLVDEHDGSGVVLAAWSPDPFRFGPFVRGDHWDYRSVALVGVDGDLESGLVTIVQDVAAGQGFEYDAARYIVGHARSYDRPRVIVNTNVDWCLACRRPYYGWGGSGLHVSLNIGFGHLYWFDPWFHPPYRYRHYSGYWSPYHDPFYWRPIHRKVWVYDPWRWHRPYRYAYRSRSGIHIGYWGRTAQPRARPGLATGYFTDGGTGRIGDELGWWRDDVRTARLRGEGRTDGVGGIGSVGEIGRLGERDARSTTGRLGTVIGTGEPRRAGSRIGEVAGSGEVRSGSSSSGRVGQAIRTGEETRPRWSPAAEPRRIGGVTDGAGRIGSGSARDATQPDRARSAVPRSGSARSASPRGSGRIGDVRSSPPPSSSRAGAIRSSPPPSSSRAGAIRSSPPPSSSRAGAIRSSPPPSSSRAGAVRSSPSSGSERIGTVRSQREAPARPGRSEPAARARGSAGSQPAATRSSPAARSSRPGGGSVSRSRPAARSAPARSGTGRASATGSARGGKKRGGGA